jgi:hypothetical protein
MITVSPILFLLPGKLVQVRPKQHFVKNDILIRKQQRGRSGRRALFRGQSCMQLFIDSMLEQNDGIVNEQRDPVIADYFISIFMPDKSLGL